MGVKAFILNGLQRIGPKYDFLGVAAISAEPTNFGLGAK